MAVDKLPQVLQKQWWFDVDDKRVFNFQGRAKRGRPKKHKKKQTILRNIELQR